MTREIDSTEPELSDRMYMARKCDLSISNHINAGGGIGFEIWKSMNMDNTWSNMIINEIQKLGIISRGIKTRESIDNPGNDYFAMNRTQPAQGIIIEYGFIDSTDYLILVNRLTELAEAVVKATVKYLGITYLEVDNMAKLIDVDPQKIQYGIQALQNLQARGIISAADEHIAKLKQSDENSLDWLNLVINERILNQFLK